MAGSERGSKPFCVTVATMNATSKHHVGTTARGGSGPKVPRVGAEWPSRADDRKRASFCAFSALGPALRAMAGVGRSTLVCQQDSAPLAMGEEVGR